MREQVEILKHEADFDAPLEDFTLLELIEQITLAPITNVVAVDGDVTAVDLFQVVDGAQQRGLARAGRPENHRDLARFNAQVNVLEHLLAAKAFAHALDLNAPCAHGCRGFTHDASPSTSRALAARAWAAKHAPCHEQSVARRSTARWSTAW